MTNLSNCCVETRNDLLRLKARPDLRAEMSGSKLGKPARLNALLLPSS